MTDTLAWNTYARQKPQRRQVNAAGETTWLNWTQYADHGPSVEVLGGLGPRSRVADLGCGKGGNIAHVATLGVAEAIGVDISPPQVKAAEARWHDTSVRFLRAEAVDYLTSAEPGFDAVFSVFGAVWFTDPARMLPAVRRALRPGGVLAFSQRPPVEGCYGCQASYIQREDGAEPLVVRRWDYEPEQWRGLLERHGFGAVSVEVIEAPEADRTGTLLVRAERTAAS